MTNTTNGRAFQAQLQQLEMLLAKVERCADPAAQEHTRAIVRAVLDLHAAGLGRVLAHLEAAGDAGRAVLDACARDEVAGGLLLLHGLHPLDVEARVREALEGVRPYLHAHGGNVELLGVVDGVVRLRLEGNCHGGPSAAATVRQTVEAAILAKAPDVTAVEVEGTLQTPPADGMARVALPLV